MANFSDLGLIGMSAVGFLLGLSSYAYSNKYHPNHVFTDKGYTFCGAIGALVVGVIPYILPDPQNITVRF